MLPNDSVDGITFVDGQAIDAQGNPMVKIDGCPNCGRRQDGAPKWMTIVAYAGARNAGRDPNDYCSRSCRLQHEWAGKLAARDGAL